MRYGYIDFDNLKKFMLKFRKDVKKPDLNGILRRMDLDGDGKISFGEFS
jgi:Ca2+-binding EF-hand superfamily protein